MESLPQADGPLVQVRLHDGQTLYAVVKSRRYETDGSGWYELKIHLPSAIDVRGRLTDQPAPVVFLAPASRCEPIEGQPYDRVPTIRHDATPDWKIEEPVYFTGDIGPARIVHRGNCHAIRDVSNAATADQARAALERPDGAACPIWRPDRVLSTRS
ncbi:DUF6233 domain-containing protein [Actinacidiphila glaucinigra]